MVPKGLIQLDWEEQILLAGTKLTVISKSQVEQKRMNQINKKSVKWIRVMLSPIF